MNYQLLNVCLVVLVSGNATTVILVIVCRAAVGLLMTIKIKLII